MIPPKVPQDANAPQSLTLQIDGKDVSCRSGQTILAVAREHGIEILTEGHASYPRVLREIHDPPGVLFVRLKSPRPP